MSFSSSHKNIMGKNSFFEKVIMLLLHRLFVTCFIRYILVNTSYSRFLSVNQNRLSVSKRSFGIEWLFDDSRLSCRVDDGMFMSYLSLQL